MRKYFRFRYRMNAVHGSIIGKTEIGEVDVEVYSLSDIEELMRVSGLGVHDVFIVPERIETPPHRGNPGIWAERHLVCGIKGRRKRKKVYIGECNFYEGNGK